MAQNGVDREVHSHKRHHNIHEHTHTMVFEAAEGKKELHLLYIKLKSGGWWLTKVAGSRDMVESHVEKFFSPTIDDWILFSVPNTPLVLKNLRTMAARHIRADSVPESTIVSEIQSGDFAGFDHHAKK